VDDLQRGSARARNPPFDHGATPGCRDGGEAASQSCGAVFKVVEPSTRPVRAGQAGPVVGDSDDNVGACLDRDLHTGCFGVLDDVRECLLKRGEEVLGHFVGDRVDWSLEPQFRREPERLARCIDLGEDVDPQPSFARGLQRENGGADLANGFVEVLCGMSDAFVDVVPGG
jgi:hypothetical protein